MIAGKRSFLVGWIRGLESWFSPSAAHCLWCGGIKKQENIRINSNVGIEKLLCIKCSESIPWITDIKCRVCGRYEDCPDCVRRSGIINRSAVQYNPLMKEWLARYKYRGSEKLEPVFFEMMGYAYRLLLEELKQRGVNSRQTVITYVPLSEKRLGERGFNQAERMAARLCNDKSLPLFPLLERTRHTEKQSYKSRKERIESLEGAFAVTTDGLLRLRKMTARRSVNVVLVDDVYTTGSTLNRCAAEIKNAGGDAVSVFGITWFR